MGANRLSPGNLLIVVCSSAICLVALLRFPLKVALLPAFLLLAFSSRRRHRVLTDWMPFIGATLLFDISRGAIFAVNTALGRLPEAAYVIDLERWVFHTRAMPLAFQAWRTPALDAAAVGLHASHFAYFLLFGLALWRTRRDLFAEFWIAVVIAMSLGLLGYFVLPTTPPWMAASPLGLLPPVAHVVTDVYGRYIPSIQTAFDTNPVAAMPSLHAAFPSICASVGRRAYGATAGVLLWLYASAVMAAIVYLGEHYAVDVLAGLLLAVISTQAARWWRFPTLTLQQSMVAGLGMAGMAAALLLASASFFSPGRVSRAALGFEDRQNALHWIPNQAGEYRGQETQEPERGADDRHPGARADVRVGAARKKQIRQQEQNDQHAAAHDSPPTG